VAYSAGSGTGKPLAWVLLLERRLGRSDDAPFERYAGGGLEAAIEHVGVEVDLSGPFDRLGVGIDARLLEQFSAFANRGEDAAARRAASAGAGKGP